MKTCVFFSLKTFISISYLVIILVCFLCLIFLDLLLVGYCNSKISLLLYSFIFVFIFKCILLIMLLQLSHFFLPFMPLCPAAASHQPSLPPLSSYPWVLQMSFFASPFPILFLTSLCLFCTYHLCFLFPVPFPPLSPLP